MPAFPFSTLVVTLTAIALAGCSDSGTSGTYLSDFRDRVEATAGPQADDCGTAAIGESRTPQNTCIADAFQAGRPAYALYQEASFDSQVFSALTSTADGAVTQLFFDADPDGEGRLDNGSIASVVCQGAMLSGNLDGEASDVFICETG